MYTKKYIKKAHDIYEGEYKGTVISGYILNKSGKYFGNSVLDAGAGDGTFVQKFREKYPHKSIIGVDLSPKNELVEEGDLTKLKFKDNSFDTIITMDVIEHMTDKDLQKALKEFARVLKQNGKLIITTKNNEDLKANSITCPHCLTTFHRVGHQQVFNQLRLKKLLSPLKFKEIRYETANLTFLGKTHLLGELMNLTGLTAFLFKLMHMDHKLHGDLYGVYLKK